ncbi:MAG: hypothetical protein ACI8RN_001015 [Glaciecola sp.]|jgi:hypothetical protein
MLRMLFFVSLLLVGQGSVASKPSQVFERCVYLSNKIEHYTQLRRRGGSYTRMESWRKSRSRYEEEFHVLRCRKFSHQLRRRKR